MFEPRYIFWILLPLCFLALSIWAVLKRLSKHSHGRESAREHLNQGFFCLAALLVSVVIDRLLLETYINTAGFGAEQIAIFRWLLYPIVLVALAHINTYFPKKKDTNERIIGSRVIR